MVQGPLQTLLSLESKSRNNPYGEPVRRLISDNKELIVKSNYKLRELKTCRL